jgi:hypothetical protein
MVVVEDSSHLQMCTFGFMCGLNIYWCRLFNLHETKEMIIMGMLWHTMEHTKYEEVHHTSFNLGYWDMSQGKNWHRSKPQDHWPAFFCNECPLCLRVRNRCDFAVGIMLCKVDGKWAPSTAQIKDLLPILQLWSLTVKCHHCFLSFIKGAGRVGKVRWTAKPAWQEDIMRDLLIQGEWCPPTMSNIGLFLHVKRAPNSGSGD